MKKIKFNFINYFLPTFLIIVHLLLLIKLKFTAWPDILFYPYLMNKGWLLYKNLLCPYPPGLFIILSFLSKIFGLSINLIQVFTTAVIILTDLLLFLVSKKIFKNDCWPILSLAFCVFWQPYFEGNGLWFDLIQTPLLLLAVYIFFQWLQEEKVKNLWLLGLILALAFFIKQTAIWLYLVTFLLVYYLERKEGLLTLFQRCIRVIAPLVFLTLLSGFIFWQQHALDEFLFWTFKFPFLVMPKMPKQSQLPDLKQLVSTIFPFIIVLLPVNIHITSKNWTKKRHPEAKPKDPIRFFGTLRMTDSRIFQDINKTVFLIFCWMTTSFLFVLPRWEKFHLQPSLVFLSLLAGPTLSITLAKKRSYFIVFGFYLLIAFLLQLKFYQQNWGWSVRFFEKEVMQVADWIKNSTKDNEHIYIHNSAEQIYFLANREPAVDFWVPTYAWNMELIGIQENLIKNLERYKPRYIVFSPYLNPLSYKPGYYRPEKLANYIFDHYAKFIEVSPGYWIFSRYSEPR